MKIVIIRIRGLVGVNKEIKKTLEILRLRRKYGCVIIDDNKINLGMLKKVENYVAFGNLDKKTLKGLLEKRGKIVGDKKLEVKNIDNFINNFFDNKATLTDIKAKPFFRLHPPIRGFKKSTKLMWPKGILGNQKEKINELIEKML